MEEEEADADGAGAAAQEVLEGALRGSAVTRLCACLEDCATRPDSPGVQPSSLYTRPSGGASEPVHAACSGSDFDWYGRAKTHDPAHPLMCL